MCEGPVLAYKGTYMNRKLSTCKLHHKTQSQDAQQYVVEWCGFIQGVFFSRPYTLDPYQALRAQKKHTSGKEVDARLTHWVWGFHAIQGLLAGGY